MSGKVERCGWAVRVGRDLREQDNAATRNPIFGVQQRVRLYGLEEASQWEWRNPDDDWDLASPEEAARLDEVMEAWDDPAPWVRRYYEDRWEFVTACLTRKGCEDYIAVNGHNLTDPRIYVYGGYRNGEWEQLRQHFLGAPDGTIESLEALNEMGADLTRERDELRATVELVKSITKSYVGSPCFSALLGEYDEDRGCGCPTCGHRAAFRALNPEEEG